MFKSLNTYRSTSVFFLFAYHGPQIHTRLNRSDHRLVLWLNSATSIKKEEEARSPGEHKHRT